MLQNVDEDDLINCHQLPSIIGSYHQFVTVTTNRLFVGNPVTTNITIILTSFHTINSDYKCMLVACADD